MAEYVNPTPSEIAEYVYSRDRTTRWVRRHSPTRNQFFSPSIPPYPPTGDDVLKDDYPSDSDSVHSDTDSLPPQMVLKYKDGRPDLPMDRPQQPSGYHHHAMSSREHSYPKDSSQYHRDQQRRYRTLSDQLDSVTLSHRTAEASGRPFRHARQQHPPPDTRALDLPPFPEEIRVLPSRTEQSSSSQSRSSHHSHYQPSRPRVTSEQPPLHLQHQNHPQPPRVPSSRHGSRPSHMHHAPPVVQTQSDPTPLNLRPKIPRPHTSHALHQALYAHPSAPGGGYSTDYSTPPTSIPSSGKHRRSSSTTYGHQHARHPAPGVPSSNQATMAYAYPAPLLPGQHPPTHVSGLATYHDSRSKRSLGKGLGDRGVVVEDPEGDDRRGSENPHYSGRKTHVKSRETTPAYVTLGTKSPGISPQSETNKKPFLARILSKFSHSDRVPPAYHLQRRHSIGASGRRH